MVIHPIPAFSDNYIWLLTDSGSRLAAVVDPGDAAPVVAALEASNLELDAILLTHHHGDHAGGVEALAGRWPEVRVYGPRDRRLPGVTETVGEGQILHLLEPPIALRVLEVPGHTSTHVAYWGEGALFCGDTLFAGGCGRVFDGTFDQLAASLERLAVLPSETWVYCAHEYTQDNLGFAAWVEPENAALAERAATVRRQREAGQPTVPSRLSEERATNPFLRTREARVKAAAERVAGRPLTTRAEVFTALRQWKDREYD